MSIFYFLVSFYFERRPKVDHHFNVFFLSFQDRQKWTLYSTYSHFFLLNFGSIFSKSYINFKNMLWFILLTWHILIMIIVMMITLCSFSIFLLFWCEATNGRWYKRSPFYQPLSYFQRKQIHWVIFIWYLCWLNYLN